ncbi:hypothetical protein NQ315_015787 [Exocentrus adspersus]|uniref:GPI transamidase component PIG-T n=1 Tax=Exocentrus adspersus TaxID=1586481 RepID=A0AAV8W4G8_9CUCU|nr:hypothetical protein NQ315_015787 [Exocentrus adspersus]
MMSKTYKMNKIISCIFYLLILTIKLARTTSETFTEELLIKPLYSEQLYAHFQFTTKWDVDPSTENFNHTRIFPRALGELLKRYNIQELHVSLTGGLWRYENWGYPVTDAAPGAEVWAWFKRDTPDVDQNWKRLANSLSGLLCASLNFVDSSNSISPEFTFQPRGVTNLSSINNKYLRYASLPREVVCTENLTPWKKLLPCGSKSGLASLLNSGYIHNTRYHSVALHLRPVCRDDSCESLALELQQSVSLVYDYLILGSRNWSLRKLFGQGVAKSCPLASRSEIFVDTTVSSTHSFELNPPPDEVVTSIRGGHESTFAKYKESQSIAVLSPPPLHANQYLTGYGQERGGIVTKIFNNHWGNLDVVLLQNIPWYVPVYLHTLKVVTNGVENNPVALRYIPGRQRERAYYLEVLLKLPPKSTTAVSIDFDYVFLKWQEYPPDANHGFYIGSAVVSTNLPLARNFTGLPQDGSTLADSFNASRSGYLVQVRTEIMVITLPTPDFSMPYNVICLACTVVALAFGPLHNITTRRLTLKPKPSEKLFVKLKRGLTEFLQK